MLGEIIKSTEALRYHAKTAEIAGQNLAHVNDENYARQRVLSKEGLMYRGQGGLNTSSLEAGGLDHARNQLLDKRVFAEFAESSNLETQKEILSLLQAALGESINRQPLSGGLDGDHDSNLSAGGLARALDDLFNSFQELSASPDEATAKEEIINKIFTLNKRFNDAGNAIDEIDSDLSDSVNSAVRNVNSLLEQIYEVNLQIKRFELLGQGKAVTYRDQRQGLLEDLSKLIDFKIDPEINQETGAETGFWNISTLDNQNQKIELMSSTNGVTSISKDFGNIIRLENNLGKGAEVRTKISADGTLGHIEVLDGGSQYDDTKGPILFALTPPLASEEGENNELTAISSYNEGDVFSQGNKLFQARQNTLAGSDLSDSTLFLEISDVPQNGQVFPESLRRYSDLESFEKGQQVYYEGKLYQAVDNVGASFALKLDESNKLQQQLIKGEVVEFENKFYQVLENKSLGAEVNIEQLVESKVGENIDGFLALGETPPQVVEDISYVLSSIDATRPDRWFLSKSYQAGDYVKFEDKFFQFTQDVFRGQEVDNLARSMQALTYDQEKNYQAGDFVELDGAYYEFTNDVPAFSDAEIVVANLSEAYGTQAQPFDGIAQLVEDPNWQFVESNGSFKVADAFREYELSGLAGSEQTKQIRISDLAGDVSDNFNFDVTINGEKIVFDNATELAAEEGVPSFSIAGFDPNTFSEALQNKLLEIEKSGVALSATQANEPAFQVQIDQTTGDLLVSGVSGLGDFEISLVTEDLAPEVGDDVLPTLTITEERAYLADKYNLVFSAEEFGELPIEVPFQGNQNDTAQSIADAVAADEQLSQNISTFVTDGKITFRAKDQGFDFTVQLNEADGLQDLHNAANDQTKLDTSTQTTATVEILQNSLVGNATEVSIEGFPEQETTYSILGIDGSVKGTITVDYQGTQEATAIAIADAINADLTLNTLITAPAPIDGVVTINGVDPGTDFANVSWDANGTTLSGQIITERVAPQLKTDQISAVSGVVQNKQVSLSFLPAQLDDQASGFSVTVAGNEIPLELPASVDPLDITRFTALENDLNSINLDGTKTADGSASTDPAFSVSFDQVSLSYIIVGNQNTGDFEVSPLANDGLDILTQQEFLSDNIKISISDDATGDEIGSVNLATLTNADVNAQAIVNAINQDQFLNQSVVASVGLDGETVNIEALDSAFSFSTDITMEDNLNAFTVTQLQPADQIQAAFIQASAPKIVRLEKNGADTVGLVSSKVQSIDFKKGEDPMIFRQNDLFYFNDENGEPVHFVVTAPTAEIDPASFNPMDEVWENNFKIFKPQLLNEDDPSIILRKAFPVGHNLENGSLVELNIGLAEAVVKKGEITGFNILNSGNGLPSTDAVFAEGRQLLVESGAIKGYQDARSNHLENFRTELNDLVTSFVEQINSLYNPDDDPDSYIFGFDAVLTRPVAGKNLLMEEEYGLFGREGDSSITLYRDEVEMSLPHTNKETFTIVNTTPIFPEEFDGETLYFRGGDYAETFFRSDDASDAISFYASASRMQNVTMENDDAYPGADLANGTEDDGRSLMEAYETIPFRLEGLEEGAKLPIIGDNFTFTALPSNPWNLATSLKVDQSFNSDSLLTSNSGVSGSNEIALSIAEMGNGNFVEKVSLLNANMGNTIAEINDNLEHQKSIETLLLDQRRGVSSVSIDEEVADLMRFQRSFQASSRVLTTLDKMLEIVVMGLIR